MDKVISNTKTHTQPSKTKKEYKLISHSASNAILKNIKTGRLINLDLNSALFESSLLSSLHPIDACHIGLKYTYTQNEKIEPRPDIPTQPSEQVINDSAELILYSYDRDLNVTFVKVETQEKTCLDPRRITFTNLINYFSPSDAFRIGILTASKIRRYC